MSRATAPFAGGAPAGCLAGAPGAGRVVWGVVAGFIADGGGAPPGRPEGVGWPAPEGVPLAPVLRRGAVVPEEGVVPVPAAFDEGRFLGAAPLAAPAGEAEGRELMMMMVTVHDDDGCGPRKC